MAGGFGAELRRIAGAAEARAARAGANAAGSKFIQLTLPHVPVRSGALRRSIRAQVSGGGLHAGLELGASGAEAAAGLAAQAAAMDAAAGSAGRLNRQHSLLRTGLRDSERVARDAGIGIGDLERAAGAAASAGGGLSQLG